MIDVFVPIPLDGRFRMIGGQSNGGWTNSKNMPDANGQ